MTAARLKPMDQPETSIPLIVALIASALSFALSFKRGRLPEDKRPSAWPIYLALGAATMLCLVVFIYRVSFVHQQWQPLQAHVDGLLLITLLLAPSIIYIQTRPKLFGLSLFALPMLCLILLWAVCASIWTYRPFNLDPQSFEPAWLVFHTAATYLGLLGFAIGAAGGAMYLFVQGRIKSKAAMKDVNPLASLETLETLIIRSATLGFVLLTLSLVTGLVMVTQTDSETALGKAWWGSPKVWLAAAAWGVYALLINVRSLSTFRGRRAAWLAIAGFVLVIATYGMVEAIDRSHEAHDRQAAEQAGGAD